MGHRGGREREVGESGGDGFGEATCDIRGNAKKVHFHAYILLHAGGYTLKISCLYQANIDYFYFYSLFFILCRN